MLRFLFGRLLVAIAVAFTLSIVAFFLLNFAVDNDHSAWGDVSEFSRVGGYPPLHFVLPAFVLGASSVPPAMRLMRTGLMDVMDADYIRPPGPKGTLAGVLSPVTPCETRSCRWSVCWRCNWVTNLVALW